MTFEVRKDNKVIGFTELEFGDPPMGFVYGALTPTSCYRKLDSKPEYALFKCDGNLHVLTEFITIVDSSEEMGEESIEVTILIKSSEQYEKYFKHHLNNYNNKLK
ncbi:MULTISPECIES: hypothetical protein [Enterobacterales]|jgi:hypothetical protein|uniref:hypothetical protein n=1 Tax=Enterobacterales TaxID=91347 RepID=UPI0002710602|nr:MULTISPECIES: hypothetical protein [Enterobacterales]KAJ9430470.1 hypothetical protein PMI39_023185 [Pantoea sp. YR343]MBB3308270.1 hypothetical protein [Enterobacter sp. Sphag1F]NYI17082.1 hypothetical protein [Enterobacter sp. Sphag71]